MSKYIKTTPLGKGAYGSVSKAKDELGNEIYALKEFSIRDEKEAKNEEKRIRNSSRIDEEEEEREKEINNFRANIAKNEDYDYD